MGEGLPLYPGVQEPLAKDPGMLRSVQDGSVF
jgi:hypothetical protein